MSALEPPFTLIPEIMELCVRIAEKVGSWNGAMRPKLSLRLRKENRIRTIQSSLAIEGNSLSLEQVTAVLEGKRVLAPKRDLLEVSNAIRAYELLSELDPYSEKAFLKAHSVLMKGLVDGEGRYRSGQVGVLKGSKVSHIAPPAKQVPAQMASLLKWLKTSKLNPFIRSSIAHYEIEFIHPFMDGNGRMGRLWQTLILCRSYSLFEFLPLEELIQKNQKEYYRSLEISDRKGDSSPFVAVILKELLNTLEEYGALAQFETQSPESRLEVAREKLTERDFSRLEYLAVVGAVSTATASRDLKWGVDQKILKMFGTQRNARYRFSRKGEGRS